MAGNARKPALRVLSTKSDDIPKGVSKPPVPQAVSEAVSAAVAAALEPFFRAGGKMSGVEASSEAEASAKENVSPEPDAEIRGIVTSLSLKVAELEARNTELEARLEALEGSKKREKRPADEKKVKVPTKKAKAEKVAEAPPKAVPKALPKEDPEALSNQQGSLTEFGLKKWCLEGYVDPKTNERVYGKNLLLSFFFSREGFWDRLKAYSQSLTQAATSAIGGKMPGDKGSFRFKLLNAGIENSNPKNLCVWLGALAADRAELCDDLGFLSGKGLAQWCHEGYIDPETNERIYGKDVLIWAYASSDFWNALKTYSLGLSEDAVAAIGGKFPHFQAPLAERMGLEKKTLQMEELFTWLGIEIPAGTKVTTTRWYLSTEGLMHWCNEGYVDPETNERVYGKDVLLAALFSDSFYKQFGEYVKSLTESQIAAIGGKISASAGNYAPRIAEWTKGLSKKGEASPRNLCLWLGALDAERAKLCDENGILSKEGLKKWYSEGYVSKNGTHVRGRECVEGFEKSQNFWEAFRDYAATLTLEDFLSMGGKFPIEPKWVALRVCGRDHIRISEFFEFLGKTALSAKENLKVQSALRQMRELLDSEEGGGTAGLETPPTVFEINQSYPGKITIICSDRGILERLLPFRNYVDETILSVASEGLERFITFDWDVH